MEEQRLRQIQELIGRKWDLIVLAHLNERPRRFMQLVRRIQSGDEGISERVLSDTLKRLSEAGLVHRSRADGACSVWAPTTRGRHIAVTIQQLAQEDPASDG